MTREAYYNTYHRKNMTWEPSEGHIIPIVDDQMCTAQSSLEKAQRLAAYYMLRWADDARIILAPCMFSRQDCHIELPGPPDSMVAEAEAFKPNMSEPWRLQAYVRAHKLAQGFI